MHQEFETRLNTHILQKRKKVMLLPNVQERLLPLRHRVKLLFLLLLYMILLEITMLMLPKHLLRIKITLGCTASTLLQCLFMTPVVTEHPPFPSSNNSTTVRTLPCTTCQQHFITEFDQQETSLRKCHKRQRRQYAMLLPRECRPIKLLLDESLLLLSCRLALQCRPSRD